ncbi:MAG TPA: hypothetical protein VJH23_04400 [archaeon]|nr:hypothetical protein [archaeon]
MIKKLLFIAALLVLCSVANAATVSGTTFEWYTLEPQENTIVEINTVPRQVLVAETGRYSFDVPAGDYNIIAEYFENNRLKYTARETIQVKADGNFTLDLILFPALDDEDYLFDDFNQLTFPSDANSTAQPQNEQGILGVALAAIAFILIMGGIIFAAKKLVKKTTGLETENIGIEQKMKMHAEILNVHESENAPAPVASQKNADKETAKAIEILKNYGGRLTQKELREKMPEYGEAKVSLIVAELEQMGVVKKFKKGRGNIIVLKQ